MSNLILPDEQELNLSESTLPVIKQIAEQLPGGFFICRADQGEEVLYLNQTLLRLFGCETREEFRALTGDTFRGMVHPEDIDAVEQTILSQISNGEDHMDHVEYRIIRKDGAVRWIDDYGHFVRTRDYGDVYYVFLTDCTERLAAAEELRREKEVIEGLSKDFTSIYLINLDNGRMRPYRLNNSYFRQIVSQLNLPEGQYTDWRNILPIYADRYVLEEDRALYLDEVSRIQERLKTESSYTVEYRCGKKDALTYMQMSLVRIDSDTLLHHAVMGYRDVTEQTLRVQKDTEDKLHFETELIREKHVNEIKSAFLFNISHDIRTPMNAIMGFTALAKKHIHEPELLADYLGKAEESSGHMMSLLDGLLEMSQLDGGNIHVHTELCDLKEQLEIVFDMHRPQAERKHIVFETALSLPEEKVYADTVRFRRIMDNIIDNAVKFTPVGGKITVSASRPRASDTGYGRYEFTVSDTGSGMSEEFMQRMYEAFEREESATMTGTIGTGVGLSITKHLLDIMGGTITVESKKDEGSVFKVYLPLKRADAKKEAQPAPQAQPNTPKPAGQRRILLVEDIEINRLLAETVLMEAGFLVESVEDGCDAVDAVREHPEHYYDLVLMDIQMPIMNGYEATRAIRALGRADTERLPIIALSANARAEDKRMSIDSGMNAHVAKPFDIANLIATIDEHTLSEETK